LRNSTAPTNNKPTVGKHGDTGDSEVRVVAAVAEGRADAGAIGEPTLVAMRAQGLEALDALEVAWRSPTYYHCTFAALPAFDPERAARFQEALLAMGDDPRFEEAMRLEGVKERWMVRGREGYETLRAAMLEQQHLV
jgi:ABC-type phosphate/phosphonate transport system substrate-binding protein